MLQRGKNSGNSEETQPGDGRKALLCSSRGRIPHAHFHTRTKEEEEHLSLLVCFFFFFPKVCSTKSLPGKLSARRKHPARSSPAWVISNISYCKPDTAREAAVKGNSRGEVWELTMWANNKYSCHFNHCTKFPTMSSICHAAEPLWDVRGTHGSHWGSWGELKLK